MTPVQKIALLTMAMSFITPQTLSAQEQPGASNLPPEPAAVIYARELAKLGGAARYCKLDSILVEEYMTKAEAQIAITANDQYEKVVARITFKDSLMVESSKKPTKDCAKIELMLKQALRSASF